MFYKIQVVKPDDISRIFYPPGWVTPMDCNIGDIFWVHKEFYESNSWIVFDGWNWDTDWLRVIGSSKEIFWRGTKIDMSYFGSSFSDSEVKLPVRHIEEYFI